MSSIGKCQKRYYKQKQSREIPKKIQIAYNDQSHNLYMQKNITARSSLRRIAEKHLHKQGIADLKTNAKDFLQQTTQIRKFKTMQKHLHIWQT